MISGEVYNIKINGIHILVNEINANFLMKSQNTFFIKVINGYESTDGKKSALDGIFNIDMLNGLLTIAFKYAGTTTEYNGFSGVGNCSEI